MKAMKKICLWAGVGLLIAAAIALIYWQGNIRSWEQKTAGYLSAITARIPTPQSAIPEERTNNAMPVLSIDGTDFVGILEMPRYGASLPVGAHWGKVSSYPCLFDGSVYDGTLQIGATTQAGQYDFYRDISVGDAVYFTDMEGNRYEYTITDLRYVNRADQAALAEKDAGLTLFIKNIYGFSYLIVSCNTPS